MRERDAALLLYDFPRAKVFLIRAAGTPRETREDDSDVNEQRAKDVAEILSLSLSKCYSFCAILCVTDDAAAL